MQQEKTSFRYESVHLSPDEQIGLHQQNDCWELSYVIVGEGKRHIGDTISRFTHGDLLFIPPGIPHCWLFDKNSTDTKGKISNITIIFNQQFLNKCADTFVEFKPYLEKIKEKTDALTFDKGTSSKIIKIMKEMQEIPPVERIPCFLKILLIIANNDKNYIAGQYQHTDKTTKRLETIKTYVICNAQRDINIDDIAKHIGMNRSSFCIFFKKATGITFITYLNEYRIGQACQLLKQKKMNISEICFQVGFNNITYFNRVFKRMTGISPSEYIQQKGCL